MPRLRPASNRVPLLAAAATLLAAALFAPLRAALVQLEPAVAPALFVLALALAALRASEALRGGAARRRARRRLELGLSRRLAVWGLALALLAFLLPLLSQWSGRPPTRISAFASLLGWLPWGDAHGHYEGGARLLAEGRFGGFSERRPLSAAWLGVRLALAAKSLPAALLLQDLLTALAAWLAARAIARRFGVAAGLAGFALILSLTRDYLPGVLTEPLGIALACLALVVLASAWARRSPNVAALGVLVLGVALQARPGAQLALPLMMAWALAVHRRRAATAALGLALAALLPPLHTRLLNLCYGAGEASATSYPAFTLYGLSHDTNYERAYQDFGDEVARRGEAAVASDLYRRSFERIRHEPQDLLRALARNEAEFWDKLHLNLARALSPRWLFAPPGARITGDAIASDRWLGGALVIACAAAYLIALWRLGVTLESGFWLAAPLGAVLSAPFVFGDAGFRGLAVVYPFLAAAVGLGLAGGRARASGAASAAEDRDVRAAVWAVGGLLLLTLAGPWPAHALSSRPSAPALRGLRPGLDAVVELAPAPKVLVSNRGETHPGVPTLRRLDFVRLLEQAEFKDAADLYALRPPAALLSGFDFVAHRQRLLIAPPRLLRETTRFLRLRIEPVAGSDFFALVEDWQPLGAAEPVP